MARLTAAERRRLSQVTLIATAIAGAWLGMSVLHECGHVCHGWLSGAKVQAMHLSPRGITSRTDFAENPHPLFVAWGGAISGSLLALVPWLFARLLRCRSRCRNVAAVSHASGLEATLVADQQKMPDTLSGMVADLAAWFAGFCLIANGAYLIGGAFVGSGGGDDGGVILRYGGARWQLLAFGFPAIALGLYLWNGLGPRFGLGASNGPIDRHAVWIAVAWLIAVAAIMTWLSRIRL